MPFAIVHYFTLVLPALVTDVLLVKVVLSLNVKLLEAAQTAPVGKTKGNMGR